MPALNGRPRKPTAFKVLEGNRGKRPLSKREPKPQSGRPAKPMSVVADQISSAEWDRLANLTTLKHARVLTIADGPMLEATCMAYARAREADAVLDADGLTYQSVTQGGGFIVRPRPEAAISAEAWRRYTAGLTHFGLSPATRGKVEAQSEDGAADPAESYLS